MFCLSSRFGHSQIQTMYQTRFTRDSSLKENLRLRQIFFNASSYATPGGRGNDELLLGLTQLPVQSVDRRFSIDITERLFRFANDLISINIQRGRDHGVPSYNEFRRMCG